METLNAKHQRNPCFSTAYVKPLLSTLSFASTFPELFFCCFQIYAYYIQARDYLACQVRIQIKIFDREVKHSLASYKNNLSEHLVKQSVSQAEA